MCENGLFRTASQVENGLENVVFPSLHDRRDDGVSALITKVIRVNLPAAVPEDTRKQHSAKSLRKGAITKLSLHKDMNECLITARSGHWGDSNMYWYLDYLNARQSLPAAQVLQVSALHKIYICSVLTSHELLQGRKHAKTKSVLPLFRCLGTKATAQVDRLLDAMFNVTISSFRKGGVHRKVLQQFALALIRHNAEVVSRCGVTNQVSYCLRQAVYIGLYELVSNLWFLFLTSSFCFKLENCYQNILRLRNIIEIIFQLTFVQFQHIIKITNFCPISTNHQNHLPTYNHQILYKLSSNFKISSKPYSNLSSSNFQQTFFQFQNIIKIIFQLIIIFSRVADYMKNEILLERTLFQNLAWAKLGKNWVSVEGVPMGLM
jgi:hypothetical protein